MTNATEGTPKRIEVHIEHSDGPFHVGDLRRIPSRNGETVSFRYTPGWLAHPLRFVLDPQLPLDEGEHHHPEGDVFGAIADSAPDRWGKDLMRRRERDVAAAEGRRPRALQTMDFLLGVADMARLGALRLRPEGETTFMAPRAEGVPTLVHLGKLVGAADRVQAGDFTDDDLKLLFTPGSSLGGARPKASVLDTNERLLIAKFPKSDDPWDIGLWESIALTLARQAGITTASFRTQKVDGRTVFLSQRFDRDGTQRIPFLSAMSMTGHKDGDGTGSYIEVAEVLTREGAHAGRDRAELFRRVAFSILVSNTDDHLRNHGFLRTNPAGWSLAPAYDINPVPAHIKAPILSTAIDLDDGTADIGLLLETIGDYGLQPAQARSIVREVAQATARWRTEAAKQGAKSSEIEEMATAFEHNRLEQSLRL